MKTIKKLTAVVTLLATIAVNANNESKINLNETQGVKSEIYKLDSPSTLQSEAFATYSDDKKRKPYFRTDGKMIYLNLLNTTLSTVNVKVYDSYHQLIYTHTFKGKNVVEKAFNFKKAYKDVYTIVVQDNESTYYKEVIIK